MNRIRLVSAVGSALLLLVCTSSWSQQTTTQQDEPAQPSAAEPAAKYDTKLEATRRIGHLTVEELVGLNVANVHKQDIGEIEKIAIGPNLKLYAIVSAGGFLGMGEDKVAIPFDELELDGEDPDRVLIDATVTEDSLRQQAGIYNPDLYQPLDDDKLLVNFTGSQQDAPQQQPANPE